ncbi:MAG: Transcriptional regulator, AbiEi antitoxin, partial [Thermoleophilales bacterium]|nr:Transcriptional regulator, AbiEi antitoxin [Thermoleophilales bacterium]
MPGPDGLASRVAAAKRGLATDDELLAAGMSRSGISRRVAAGRLTPIYRGVYLVGHSVPPPLAIELGAVIACSPAAFLGHFS